MTVPGSLGVLWQGRREEVAAETTPVGLVDPPLVRVSYEVVVAVSSLGYSSGLLPPHLAEKIPWKKTNSPVKKSGAWRCSQQRQRGK